MEFFVVCLRVCPLHGGLACCCVCVCILFYLSLPGVIWVWFVVLCCVNVVLCFCGVYWGMVVFCYGFVFCFVVFLFRFAGVVVAGCFVFCGLFYIFVVGFWFSVSVRLCAFGTVL